MYMIFVYWGLLIASYIIATGFKNKEKYASLADKGMMIAIYILVFFMGLRMGINEKVIEGLGTIGVKSLIITVATIIGSIIAVFVARKLMNIDRYGNLRRNDNVSASCGIETISNESSSIGNDSSSVQVYSGALESDENTVDYKGTLIIISLVALGIILGKFVILDHMPDTLTWLSDLLGNMLTIFLCILIVIIGFVLGFSGTVIANIKRAGLRILVIPLAIIVGSFVIGAGSAVVMGFSIRESLAIVCGFGWYSYGPVVISAAGSQYAVTSAVSFMHNVMRETAGIIFIPIVAKKLGYIESLALPGIGTMDVCMPMVEKSCRADTVAYGFISGFTICIVTSVMEPLLMSI